MAKIAICDKYKKPYDYIPETVIEGGTTYTTVVCNKCGNIKKTSVNHIHYGNDSLNK
jgi:hypothetical protein